MGLSGFNLLGTFIFRMVIEDVLVYLDKDPHNSSARLYNDGCFVIYTYWRQQQMVTTCNGFRNFVEILALVISHIWTEHPECQKFRPVS